MNLVGGARNHQDIERLDRRVRLAYGGPETGEIMLADQFARAPYRMAEAERGLLAGETGGACAGQVVRQVAQVAMFAALAQRHFEFELPVEMILNHRLVAAGHKDEMLDPRLARLIDHVLD